LKKAHLGANLDQIAGSGHGRVPQLLDGVALLQNQDDLDNIDDALKGAHEVEQPSAVPMRALLEGQQEGDDGNTGDDEAEDGDDLGDPAPQIRLHDVGVRQDAFVVSEAVHGAHGHEALRNQRKDLGENQHSASCTARRKGSIQTYYGDNDPDAVPSQPKNPRRHLPSWRDGGGLRP